MNTLLRLAGVLYLCVGIAATFTGKTNAFFSNSVTLTGSIQAGTWETEDPGDKQHGEWDNSSLKFVSAHYDGKEISAIFKNGGEDMKTNGLYEIYYSEKGGPKQGKVITEILTFKPLKKGEEIKLIFTPQNSGKYKFKVYQHKDHPGKGELWSDDISVNLAKQKVERIEEQGEPEKQDKADTSETIVEEPVREEKSEEPRKIEKNSQTDVNEVKDFNTSEVQDEVEKEAIPSGNIENSEN